MCMVMLRGIVQALEKHHNVRILDEAVNSAVKLSHRYIAGRQLPDKAVSVLGHGLRAAVAGSEHDPGAARNAKRRLDDLNVQERVLTREAVSARTTANG